MSWVKAASFNGEDVFDENADDLYLQSKEWASNMKKRIKVKLALAHLSELRLWCDFSLWLIVAFWFIVLNRTVMWTE